MEIKKQKVVTTIVKEEGRPFRVLQLTDIHIGGGILCFRKDRWALEAVEKVVKAADPDLIVCTGDMIYPLFWATGSHNNLRAAKKLGIPRRNIAMIGDQYFTDILGGKLAGVKTVMVSFFTGS